MMAYVMAESKMKKKIRKQKEKKKYNDKTRLLIN